MVTQFVLSKMRMLLFNISLSVSCILPQRSWAGTSPSPNAVHEERRALLAEPTLERENIYWASMGTHGSLYDGDLEMLLGRAGAAYSMGYRWERYGVLSMIQFDSFWDFGQEISRMSSVSAAVGVERLFLHGRARTAVSIGFSTLLNKTALVSAGQTGFLFDFTPIAVRFPWGSVYAFEVAPLHYSSHWFETTYPPFILSQFVTSLNLEWVL